MIILTIQNLTYLVIIFFSWYFRYCWEIKACCIFSDQLCICFKGFEKKVCVWFTFLCKRIYSCEIFQSSNLDQPQRNINASLVNYFRVFETISVSCELFSSGWDPSQRRNWNSIRCQLRGITQTRRHQISTFILRFST